MLTIFLIILPIFLVMLVGYITTRVGLLSQKSLSDMGRFVINVALPAVIIKTVLHIDIQAMLNYRYLLAYLLCSLSLTVVGVIFYLKVFKLTRLDASVSVTGMVVPNSSFIGYPVILQLIANPPVNAFAMALLVENIFVLPLCFLLMDYSSIDSQQTLKTKLKTLLLRIVKNPLLIAIVIGVIGNLLHIRVPKAIHTTLDILAPSAVAVALFVIGGVLAGIRIRQANMKHILAITLGKLILHPLLAIIMLSLLVTGAHDLKLALVIITSMPMFSIYSVIGDIYGKQALCSSSQLVANGLSIVTIPIMIALAEWAF